MEPASVEDSLKIANLSLASRDPEGAETAYRRILEQNPRQPEALHGMALIVAQSGRAEAAEGLLSRALGVEPGRTEWLYQLGLLQLQQRKLVEASDTLQQVIAFEPEFPDAYNSLGVVLKLRGNVQEATVCYRKALDLNPNFPEAANNLGVALKELGRCDESVEAFDRALRCRPEYPEALCNLAEALRATGDIEQAETALERAAALRPGEPDIWYNLGTLLQHRDRADRAADAYRKVLALRPDHIAALNNLGNVLHSKRDFNGAVATYSQALELRSDAAELHNNLGRSLKEMGRLNEAIAAYRKAISCRSEFTDAYTNLGNALVQNGDLESGIHALANAADTPGGRGSPNGAPVSDQQFNAQWNYACALLLRGDFERGWEKYEVRNRKNAAKLRSDFGESLWDGSELNGRQILLVEEQGLGDTIQFVRYAPMVARRGGKVLLCCQPALKSLMQGQAGIEEVIASGEALPRFDVYCPLMSLPHLFQTRRDTIPAQVPYLLPDPLRVSRWTRRMEPYSDQLRVGLTWAGNPSHVNDRERSIESTAFAPLADVKGVTFFSLQKGERANEIRNLPATMQIVDLDGVLTDFAETAAVIANLDLVISVDTSVVHLAGALAKPVWTLLPYIPDWRWGLESTDSPWYPTMRLFRQLRRADWNGVMQEVHAHLLQAPTAKDQIRK